MENQISPKTEVAELELEAVIGFNGEVSSMSGLNGLGSLGRVVPTGRANTGWHLGGSVGLWHEPQPKPSTREANSLPCPVFLQSHLLASDLKE